MRIMATKSTIKCYIDSERVANVPAVRLRARRVRVHMDPWTDEPNNPMLIEASVRRGGKTLKQQVDEEDASSRMGSCSTPDPTGSRPMSFKTLSDIGQLLAENPSFDCPSRGTPMRRADAANLTLSDIARSP